MTSPWSMHLVQVRAWRNSISVVCVAALLYGQSLANFSSLQSPAAKKTIIIHAGRLIDTARNQVRARVSISIEGDRIKELQDGFITLPNAQVIDLSSSTVLPGLIDCHKHLTLHQRGPNPFQELVTETPVDAAFYAAANARLALLNGFTGVRDVGASGNVDVSLKHAIERGTVIGPRLWVAGVPLGPTGGHSDRANGVAGDITNPEWNGALVDSPDDARKAIRQHHRAGTNLIKIMPSGGVGSIGDDPKLQLMTNEEIQAAIETAHALGMKIAAHAHGKAAIDAPARSQRLRRNFRKLCRRCRCQ